ASDLLESHLHATVKKMLSDKTVAPFIVPPSSGKFGHVKSFEVAKRGVSGTAIELAINTSDGGWLIRKELVIRDIFRLPKPKPARLKSARLFFDHQRDKLGLLSSLSIKGLGWGHGVGMQQTRAQGWARKGLDYRSILNHYFTTVRIERM
ncbi:MAG: hypothetical protein K8F91_00210, partial [Candidatus Obscuribacterales bacterium]|nr:hypothetical protein [Candidatus Obscuribacterales bacterium]